MRITTIATTTTTITITTIASTGNYVVTLVGAHTWNVTFSLTIVNTVDEIAMMAFPLPIRYVVLSTCSQLANKRKFITIDQ